MAIEFGDEEGESGNVFHWAREKGLWVYVTAFFMVSILIHGSGFYLFQVVYPSPVRKESDSKQISILDKSNPSVRAILQRVSDRTIYLKPPSTSADVRIRLKNNPVRFTPAFQETKISLEPLHYRWTIPATIEPLEGFAAGGPVAGKLRVRLSESLQVRGIAPWSIMTDYFERAESLPNLRFELEVSLEGNVKVKNIDSELEEEEEDALRVLVESTLRFNSGNEQQTGSLEIFVEG